MNTLHEGLDGNYKLKGKTQQHICEEQSSAVDDITLNDNTKKDSNRYVRREKIGSERLIKSKD